MSYLVVVATLLAAGVEWVEALTIVLAVGIFKGWRSALFGTLAAAVALTAVVAIFGFTITSYVSITAARTVVGFFLLVFGLRWLSKAVLRASGLKAMRDEAEEFEETKEYLEKQSGRGFWNLDRAGFSTSFSGVFLEGLEVVFIVIALGGLNSMPAAITGAGLGLVGVVVLGVVARHPLTRVPENAMKYVVGVMLTSFGTFFAGEGVGVTWWRDDVVLLPLLAFYLIASLMLIAFLRRPVRAHRRQTAVERAARVVISEIWGLLVGDSAIAVVALAVVFGVGLAMAKLTGAGSEGQFLIVGGALFAILVGIFESGAKRKVITEEAEAEPALATTASSDGHVSAGQAGERQPAS
jgi:uncharacterized membrane protein